MHNINNFIKRLFLLALTLININWQNMEFKILDWTYANKLKQEKNAVHIRRLDFNFSNIFMLSDSSYLIMPLNPFGQSILTSKKELLNKWISKQHFPLKDEDDFYFNNKEKIYTLNSYRDTLKKELFMYIYKSDKKDLAHISPKEIDEIYALLKKRRKYQEYKLNFTVLVGDYIIDQNKGDNYIWGILKIKQLLNPIFHLSLIKNKELRYYDIEEKLNGKVAYAGIQYFLKDIEDNLTKKPNEFSEIYKVLN